MPCSRGRRAHHSKVTLPGKKLLAGQWLTPGRIFSLSTSEKKRATGRPNVGGGKQGGDPLSGRPASLE
ncbi:hypothetical protein E2C01_007584 [Portunus trituberculatus]|uniref:Uncharacterized protein n=1 Tax=Portunus trituberculatus TaxID=210409 RepID=A0A5B7CZT5_PORTR|nr:hypothetical protein [Portunus trituberculatus]